MDKVYQVFVSSTFADLKEERQEVSNTLAKAGYIAAGMELFPATDQQQLEYIQRVIDRSDYYVVILGARYGSLAEDGKSYTEREFEYAKSRGIPVLAFLHEEPRALSVAKTDEDPKKAKSLKAFRVKLQTGRIVEFWRDKSDLCTKVLIAVANAANLTPRVGWVRGDQAIDPKVLQELERLRIENADLRERLSKTDADELAFDPDLLGPDDLMEFELIENVKYQPQPSTRRLEARIGDVFIHAYDTILAGPPEEAMPVELARAVFRAASVDSVHGWELKQPSVVSLRNQLLALGLVEVVSKQKPSKVAEWEEPTFIAWEVTSKGRKFASSRNALRKSTPA